MAAAKIGNVAFSTAYPPPLPLDIYSCPIPTTSKNDKILMTERSESSNYNAKLIPRAALETILKRRPELASEGKEGDVDLRRLSGILFVSRRGNLKALQIALHFNDNANPKVFDFSDVFDTFKGVHIEDSGCFANDYLIYVSTVDPATHRPPWTAIYKTNLKTGETNCLTPLGQADLSPSVSPSGKKIAMASFEIKGGWDGEIKDLKTDIFVANVENQVERKLVVSNGGWPSWGSDKIIFFHRKEEGRWGVFRADISTGVTSRVTPQEIDAMTPAAYNDTIVAVATIRQKSEVGDIRVAAQCRHIEIFDSTGRHQPLKITIKTSPEADHFHPVVIDGHDGTRVGYHCLKSGDDIPRQLPKDNSPHPEVGFFPTFSNDGSKLAFIDNKCSAVWLADRKGLRMVFKTVRNNVFSPVWNQDTHKDILYACFGHSLHGKLSICAIPETSKGRQQLKFLTRPPTKNGFPSNNAFPSTNPDGTKLVYRSTRDWDDKGYKNLYIMEDAELGEFGDGRITRLTNGPWTDTHCQWSPHGDWIVFSSNRDNPADASPHDNDLDPRYFAVFLVKANDPLVVVRVIATGSDPVRHGNRPFFSLDGKSIIMTAAIAAVSFDFSTSNLILLHTTRPYGDDFIVDLKLVNINENENVNNLNIVKHSRYENSIASRTMFSTQGPIPPSNLLLDKVEAPSCPYLYPSGGEHWQITALERFR